MVDRGWIAGGDLFLALNAPLVTPLPKPYPSFRSPPRPLAESVSGGADDDRFLGPELVRGLGRGRGGYLVAREVPS